MIVNTGGRTDTVQFYSDWLLRRFEEGYALSRNPLFPNKVSRIELDPEVVDCVMFCSKDYAPILPRLHEITDRFNTFFHYTITAYGKDVEPGVPPIEEAIDTLKRLSAQVGKGRVAWRYDPVLLTETYTVERHLETFEAMAAELAPHVDRCVFSFVEMYKKLETNMPELVPLTEADKDALAKGMGETAARHGLYLQTCGTNGDYSRYGIHPSGCMTLEAIGAANGVCEYCYANKRPDIAAKNCRLHDPASPLLLGHLRDTDVLTQASQKSFLAKGSPRKGCPQAERLAGEEG